MSSADSAESSQVEPDPPSDSSSDPSSDTGRDRGERRALARPVATSDESSLALVALRDVAAFAVLLSLFGAADTWARTTGLVLAQCVVVLDGLLIGATSAALLHEWGHFLGARLGGGHSPIKPIASFPQVFDFDYKNNDAKSFRWMSVGGSVGNWGAVLLFGVALPLGSIGPDALVSGAVAFSVFTSCVEFPVIRKAARGMPGLQALRTIPKDFATRYLPQALGAGLVTFALL